MVGQRNFAFIPYEDLWRMGRRYSQQHFSEQVVPQYQTQVLRFVRELLNRLLDTNEEFTTPLFWCVQAQYNLRAVSTLMLITRFSAFKYRL